jgi:hypothetical protein
LENATRACWPDGPAAGAAARGALPESLTEPPALCVFDPESCALRAVEPESCELCDELTFATAWTPFELVDACVETVAGGVETVAAVLACDEVTPALPDVEAGGVVVVLVAETAAGAASALAETDTDGAGVLALASTLAAGGVVETDAEAGTGALGVAGAPGRPSAWAGTA